MIGLRPILENNAVINVLPSAVSALGIGTLEMLIVRWPAGGPDMDHQGMSESERGENHLDGVLLVTTGKALRLIGSFASYNGRLGRLQADGFVTMYSAQSCNPVSP